MGFKIVFWPCRVCGWAAGCQVRYVRGRRFDGEVCGLICFFGRFFYGFMNSGKSLKTERGGKEKGWEAFDGGPK